MAPTLVAVALGVLLGVALLGPAFDRRTLAIVGFAAALPDLDAVVSLAIPGVTNALLHSAFVPLAVFAVLYWDTRRPESWLRGRYGWGGVRVAWVGLASYVVAGIGLDLCTSGVALLYPLLEEYYVVTGKLVLSSQEGVVQTYLEFGEGWPALESPGRTGSHHVETWVNPAPADGSGAVERRLTLVETGWQFVIVVTAVAAAVAKGALEGGDR